MRVIDLIVLVCLIRNTGQLIRPGRDDEAHQAAQIVTVVAKVGRQLFEQLRMG